MLLQVFHNYFHSVCSLSFLSGFFHRSEVDQFGEVTHLIFPLAHHGVNSYLFFLALAIQHNFQSAWRHTCLISAFGDRDRQIEVISRSTWSKQRVLGKLATISKQTKTNKKPCHHVFLYFFLKVLMGSCFRYKSEIHFWVILWPWCEVVVDGLLLLFGFGCYCFALTTPWGEGPGAEEPERGSLSISCLC